MRDIFHIFTVALLCWPICVRAEATPLLLCGAEQVWTYDPIPGTNTWQWQASDSPEIPESAHRFFRTTDDCKPFGPYLLVTSSSGGVALILRETKRCAFYTYARNAHSACLLPGMRVAVAASTGGDALLVFDRRKSGAAVEPLHRIPLQGAHGVVWDANDETCWALGTEVLLKFDYRFQETGRFPLPTPGGHDLSVGADTNILFVTSNTAVYRYAKTTATFTPHPQLGGLAKIKSIDQHPVTKQLVFQQAKPETWWGHHVHFEKERNAHAFPGERLYKIRWDVPAATPRDHLVRRLRADGAHVFLDEKGRIKEVVLNQLANAADHAHRLAWMPYLTDLSLEQTTIGDASLSHLASLHRLEWLNLWKTRISDAGLKHLAGLTALQHLPVGGTRVTDAGLPHLKNLNELHYLGLRGNAITDAGLPHLLGFEQLKELNLSETQISDAAVPHLEKMTSLTKLWLLNTAVSDQGMGRLRNALPGCLIFR